MNISIPDDFFVNWHQEHGRSFPWRDEGVTPFGILVAEVLLQQTRAEMVAKVWPSLVKQYPGPDELAVADPEDLFDLVSGLGFGNKRTIALIDLASAAKQCEALPSLPEELMQLPFIGMYSAHAVACFGFALRVPIVDLSVARVISRIIGAVPPKDIRRAPRIWDFAWEILPASSFVEHNYGLLDFAATTCTARSPLCEQCPLAAGCSYGRSRSNCAQSR